MLERKIVGAPEGERWDNKASLLEFFLPVQEGLYLVVCCNLGRNFLTFTMQVIILVVSFLHTKIYTQYSTQQKCAQWNFSKETSPLTQSEISTKSFLATKVHNFLTYFLIPNTKLITSFLSPLKTMEKKILKKV